MNRKMIGIIGIIIIIFVIVGILLYNQKHNSIQNGIDGFNKKSISIKGYTININSKKVGNSSDKSYFNTSFDIKDNDKKINKYNVDFVDLELFSDSDNDGIIYDVERPEEVTINDKKYEYYLSNYNLNATLYYRLPDGKGRLIIEVRGGNVFDSRGEQLKKLAVVDNKVLESKELAEILDFSVNK